MESTPEQRRQEREADEQRRRNLEAMEMMAEAGVSEGGGRTPPQCCQSCAWREHREAPRLFDHLGGLAQGADEAMRSGLSCRGGGKWDDAAERFAEAERLYFALAQLAAWERLNAARLPMEQRFREERERMLSAGRGGDDGLPFV